MAQSQCFFSLSNCALLFRNVPTLKPGESMQNVPMDIRKDMNACDEVLEVTAGIHIISVGNLASPKIKIMSPVYIYIYR